MLQHVSISHLSFSNSASTFLLRGKPIGMQLFIYFVISSSLHLLVFLYPAIIYNYQLTVMLIGLLALKLDVLLRDIVSSLVRHLYLGKLRSKPLFLVHRLKLNIGALLPLFVSSYGYRIYFVILISLFLFLYLFGVIIKQPSILLLTLFFMSALSTWISIVTLFVINLSLALFTLNIFLHVFKCQIYLPRHCLLLSFIFYVPS